MKINNVFYTLIAASFALSASAQKSDGTTKSLVNAERAFAAAAAKDGEKSAFLSFASSDAVLFRPNPVNVKTYFSGKDNHSNVSWSPVYTRVSRSGDWGFSTGPYQVEGEEKSYGQYVSIWKAVNGKWVLKTDIGSSHNKPLEKVTEKFVEPASYYRPKMITEKQTAAGNDIIYTTEKTLNATLKSYGGAAFAGFVNPDVRVIFPGREPIIGKDKALVFYNSMVSKMNLKTNKAEKALGGDLAYTTGLATIDYKADLRESFHYVFVYELQKDHNWNLILQIYTPAER